MAFNTVNQQFFLSKGEMQGIAEMYRLGNAMAVNIIFKREELPVTHTQWNQAAAKAGNFLKEIDYKLQEQYRGGN